MTDENSNNKSNITRRHMLAGMASIPAIAMMGGPLLASDFPTAEVNTTGLAVTDDKVTVGILHSVTGTMAISETGSVQAEKLAIEHINASGGVLGRQIEYIQEDGASDWPTFAEKAKKLLVQDKEGMKAEFGRLLEWEFDKLIAAHGTFLESGAHQEVVAAVEKMFG